MKALFRRYISLILSAAVVLTAFPSTTVLSSAELAYVESTISGNYTLKPNITHLISGNASVSWIDFMGIEYMRTDSLNSGILRLSFYDKSAVANCTYAIAYTPLDPSSAISSTIDLNSYSFAEMFITPNTTWSQIMHPVFSNTALTGRSAGNLGAEEVAVRVSIPLQSGKYVVGIYAFDAATPDLANNTAGLYGYFYAPEYEGASSYKYYTENFGGGTAYRDVSDTTVWRGGGKTLFQNGAVYNGKISQIQLFEIENGGYFNVTTAKTTQWGLFENSTPAVTENYKLISTANKNIAKISKGKITAGKETGTVYAQAVAGINKKTESPGLSAGAVLVHNKQAATLPRVFDAPSAITDRMPVKAVAAPINVPVKIYGEGFYKGESGPESADTGNTFNVSIDHKFREYLQVSLSDAADSFTGSLQSLTADKIRTGFYIKGLKLNAKGKPVKAAVIIQNIQSGKKVKLSVNVNNSVTGTVTGGAAVTIERNPEEAETGATAEMRGVYYQTALPSEPTTDKGKACIMTKETYDATIEKGDYSKIIGENGKVKFSSDLKIDGITISYKNDIAEVKVKKGKAPADDISYIAVVVFNTNKDTDGKYTGIVPVQFDVIKTDVPASTDTT